MLDCCKTCGFIIAFHMFYDQTCKTSQNTFNFHSRTALCLLLKYSDMQNRKTVWRAMKQVAVSRHIAEDKG